MKFSLSSSVVVLTTLLSSVSAVPSSRPPCPPPSKPIAAVYWGTNEASNNLMTANVLANGTLAYSTTYATGGKGLHGTTSPITNPDGLFSANSIFVHTKLNLLAITNSGSNSVSLFSINPQNPTDLRLIGTSPSGGDFPNSVTINKAGTQACVLNTGARNGIQCFTVDLRRGLLPVSSIWRPLGLPQTNPPTGPPGTAGHVFYNEDETKLIVSVKAIAPALGHLALYDILPGNTISSTAKFIQAPSGGSLPFGTVLIPGRNAVLAADGAIGGEVFDLAHNTSTPFDIPGQGLTCWAAFSKKTTNYYLSDPVAAAITELTIDQNLKPTLVKQYPLASGALNLDLTIVAHNGQEWMYTVSPGTRTIDVLTLSGPGNANFIQHLDIHAVAPEVTIGISLQGINSYVIGA